MIFLLYIISVLYMEENNNNYDSVAYNIKKILPNLLDINNKSANNIVNKVKVNSFFNSHENKAKEKLLDLIKLSEFRHKYAKNGESLNGIIIKSSEDFKKICHNITDDNNFVKNALLQEEAKVLREKVNYKDRKKVTDLVSKIRDNLEGKKIIIVPKKKVIPKLNLRTFYIDQSEKANNILNDKFNNEQNSLNKNFSTYKDKLSLLKNFPELKKRNFGNFEFSYKLDCLYYKKPNNKESKKKKTKKESTSLNQINRILLSDVENNSTKNLTVKNRLINLKENLLNGFPINNYKDTIDVVKSETSNNFLYGLKMNEKKNKFIKLMGKGLNKPYEYDTILNKEKLKKNNDKILEQLTQDNIINEDKKKIFYSDTKNYEDEFKLLKKQSEDLLQDDYFINKLFQNQKNYKNVIANNLKNKKKNLRSLSDVYNNQLSNNQPKVIKPNSTFFNINNIDINTVSNNTNEMSTTTNFDIIIREKRNQILGRNRQYDSLSNKTFSKSNVYYKEKNLLKIIN